ncbi:hypothetical protein H0H87_009756 [Tephrocybe sp. NHM501043]|nr:hypothetical protein H0H87_009756 [Tephrocybe sp. NHM501043]
MALLCLALGVLGAVLHPLEKVCTLRKKRDDNLPARVPYVFPPPGTDPVSIFMDHQVTAYDLNARL